MKRQVPVTVYVLHHAVRLSLQLNLVTNPAVPPLVCCAALGTHMLLVWLPGHAATLFDLGLGHAPTHSLSAPVMPLSCATSDDDGYLSALSWGPPGEGLKGRLLMLHPRTGSLLSLEIDRSALLELVVSPGPPESHVRALHAAVVHLRDAELYQQMAMHALSRSQGVVASRELLAEYLVATTHLRIASEGRLPPSVLAVLPLTTMPSLLASAAVCSPLHGFLVTVSAKGELLLEIDNSTSAASSASSVPASPARVSLSAAVAASPGPGSPLLSDNSPTAPASGVSRLVQLLFGRDEADALPPGPAEGEGPDGPEQVSVCEAWGARYEEGLAELLFRQLHEKEPRAKCLRYARLARRAQLAQVGELFKCIVDSANLLANDAAMFRVLENFYCVLEELSLPLPSGFMSMFCELGLKVLSPTLFLQYVDRQVFYLADSLVCSLLPKCGASPSLRLALASRMRDSELLASTLWKENGEIANAQVADYVVAQTGVALPEQQDVRLLESAEEALFLPLAVFRQHVRNRVGAQKVTDEQIEFVYQKVVSNIKADIGMNLD